MSRVSFRNAGRVSDYADKRYRGQLQRRVSKWERTIVARILQRVGASGASILDIPSGYGRFTDIVKSAGAKLLAADISSGMVIRAAVGARADGCTSFVADAAAIPLKDKSVDGTITVRLLQHLTDGKLRVSILRELCRVASRFVLVTFYDSEGLHALQRLLKKKSRRTRKHIEFLTRFQFSGEADAAGLEVVEFFPVRRIFHAQCFVLLKPKR